MIDAKNDTIKMLRAKIVDQGKMSYEILDERNEHKRTARQMKKLADGAAKLSIGCHEKMKAATYTVQCLQDQLAQMQDTLHNLGKTSDEKNCRIMDLDEENMDLMDTIHVSRGDNHKR